MQHAITWFEIPATNLTRAMGFYQTVTGNALRRETFGAQGEEMAVFEVEPQTGVSGCLQLGRPAQDGTLVYLDAAPSLDAWLARVEKAGGKITMPKTALPPGMGFFAHIQDTEGNRVGLHAPA